jgi:hypothetical protein
LESLQILKKFAFFKKFSYICIIKPKKLKVMQKNKNAKVLEYIKAHKRDVEKLREIKKIYDSCEMVSGAFASDMYREIDEHIRYCEKAIKILEKYC